MMSATDSALSGRVAVGRASGPRTGGRRDSGRDRAARIRLWLGVLSCAVMAAVGMRALIVPGTGSARLSSNPLSASGQRGWSSLPAAARGAVSRGLGADDRSFWARRTAPGVFTLRSPAQRLLATVSSDQLAVSGAGGVRLRLSSVSLGRPGADLRAPMTAAPADANQVVLSSGALRESYANGPWGLEQTFTLARRPAGRGPVTISQTMSGNPTARLDAGGRGVTFASPAGTLRYDGLVVTDALGRSVPARLRVAGRRLTISISDARASYPLRVDPTIHQTAELTASDGAVDDQLGFTVAASATTIVAAAMARTIGSNANQGVVYVYTLPAAGGWADATQTAELTASDGGASDFLGGSLAVSGSTIVAGSSNHNGGRGAVYEYTMPVGGWVDATQTAELTASDAALYDYLGWAVAISGTTIVAGAIGRNGAQGTVYVYTMPASGGWADATQTAELTASDGAASDQLGNSVAISGTTIVAGSLFHGVRANFQQGAAYG
jgi:hypothetical protein